MEINKIQKENPKLARPSDEYRVVVFNVSVIAIFFLIKIKCRDIQKMSVRKHKIAEMPFQMYNPNALVSIRKGLQKIFNIEKNPEIKANTQLIAKNITVASHRPLLKNSSSKDNLVA